MSICLISSWHMVFYCFRVSLDKAHCSAPLHPASLFLVGTGWTWDRVGMGQPASSVSSLHPGPLAARPLYCADVSGSDAGCTPAAVWDDVGLFHRRHKDPVGSRKTCSPAASTHGRHRREWPQADLNTGTTKKKPCKSQLLNALKSAKSPKTGMQDTGSGCAAQEKWACRCAAVATHPAFATRETGAFWGLFSLAWIKFNLKMHKASITAKQSL